MAEERMRLSNPHRFNVGIITPDKPYGQNIAPGAFTFVTKDEVDYLMATCSLLQRGILRVQGEKKAEIEAEMNIDTENNANFMSDEDIRKKLSGNANQLRKWLNNGKFEPFVLEKIAGIAKDMNLSLSKIQVLQEVLPEYEFTK